MSNHRAAHYEKSKGYAEGMEALSCKLQEDLRFNSDFPVLSVEWMNMAQQAQRIGEITEMERNLPKAKDATLWECEEVALRYIIEDGKLNLCLRNLAAYNKFLITIDRSDESIESAARIAMNQFERGMGATLKNAWLHAEAVQTTDLPLLVEYVHDVLRYHVDNPKIEESIDIESSQQVSAIYYLYGLSRQLENMDESRIMPLILEKKIFSLLAIQLSMQHENFTQETILASLETMSQFASTEHFQSHLEDYVSCDETVQALASIQGRRNILSSFMQQIDKRRRFRPLLDAVRIACRK